MKRIPKDECPDEGGEWLKCPWEKCQYEWCYMGKQPFYASCPKCKGSVPTALLKELRAKRRRG